MRIIETLLEEIPPNECC